MIALGLVIPTNVKLLAGIYAFGATLAITIAHLSIIRLRVTDPDRAAARSGSPGTCAGAARELPLPAIFAAVLSGLAFLSVLAYHDTRPLGRRRLDGCSGSLFYVVYRKVFEGTTLTRRVSVTERGADQAGARGRVPQHPRAGLRHRARRRHRRHRRPPGRAPSSEEPRAADGRARGSTSST